MAKIREADVDNLPTRQETGPRLHIERPRRQRSGIGSVIFVLFIAVAIGAFAYSQGRDASASDMVGDVHRQVSAAIESAGAALREDASANQSSDPATN